MKKAVTIKYNNRDSEAVKAMRTICKNFAGAKLQATPLKESGRFDVYVYLDAPDIPFGLKARAALVSALKPYAD
jgi:hypothetical protein